MSDDLEDRFRFHDNSRYARADEHRTVREELAAAAQTVVQVVPPGREQSLALTKLEEAMFWANAGIARAVD